ncbi:MFS transporter [Paenibacillus cineris]|uniref:MFS transporter n=1 Tax=Paenibacillus cineris TaxID=237530 RepID=A0ABQ4L8Y5_9BACL|nr:MFS transporter [Paenibacillus cineris]GIO53039.1 MFS transporter [Paenibacillus cineris]
MISFKTRPQHRRKTSMQRRNLRVASLEGIPAVMFMTLLGGQFLTGYLLYLGASSGEIGFVLAITTFVNIVQIFAAYLIQRLRSRKWTLVLFVAVHRVIWGSTGLVPFIVPKPYWVPAFIVLYTVAFMFNTLGGILWNSLISDMVHPKVRGRYFGIRNTILNALGTLVMYGGGVILDHEPGGKGFLLLYIIVWVCIVANIAVFFFYPDIPFERSSEKRFIPMLKKPLRDASFLKATLFLAGFLFLQNLVVPLYSYVMLEMLHINYKTLSLLNVLQTVSMMASFYVWGNLNVRHSNRRLLFWTLPIIALSCLCWGLLSVLPMLPVLIAAHMIFGIGVGGFNQLAFNFMIGDTPKAERPMYMAMYAAITGVAAFFGPLIGGNLYELIGHWPEWTRIYGVQIVVGLSMLLLTVSLGRKILRNS